VVWELSALVHRYDRNTARADEGAVRHLANRGLVPRADQDRRLGTQHPAITGVNYATAWLLLQKMRAAMDQAGRQRLSGDVEFDETYVGAWTLELQGAHAGKSPSRSPARSSRRPPWAASASLDCRRFRLAIADFLEQSVEPAPC